VLEIVTCMGIFYDLGGGAHSEKFQKRNEWSFEILVCQMHSLDFPARL
jgi:hypothetical protein